MQVGSYLDPRDLKVCTMQLCSTGVGFVANLFANDTATIRLNELIACCRRSVRVRDVAQHGIARIELFVKRRGNIQTIILDARLRGTNAKKNASVYSDFHRRLRQGPSLQLSQNQAITVEWHVSAKSIAQVEFLLKMDVANDDASVSDSSAGGVMRPCLHTLNLKHTQVSDLCALASCQSLHT
jgi:hypothetical protein